MSGFTSRAGTRLGHQVADTFSVAAQEVLKKMIRRMLLLGKDDATFKKHMGLTQGQLETLNQQLCKMCLAEDKAELGNRIQDELVPLLIKDHLWAMEPRPSEGDHGNVAPDGVGDVRQRLTEYQSRQCQSNYSM